jgi:hypothetical protein
LPDVAQIRVIRVQRHEDLAHLGKDSLENSNGETIALWIVGEVSDQQITDAYELTPSELF